MRQLLRENLSSQTLNRLRTVRDHLLGWSTALGGAILELGLSLAEYGIASPVTEAEFLGNRLMEKGNEFVQAGNRHPEYIKPTLTHFPEQDHQVLDCCVAYNQYGGYCIPLSSIHRPAAREILKGRVYEEETIKYIKQEYNGGDIVHAGSYFGDFIPALSHMCGPNSKVWAFEPNPESYRCANITILINGIKNVELTNVGLGNINDILPLIVSTKSGEKAGGLSTFTSGKSYASGEKTTKSEVVKLDDVLPKDREVSFIHLDVEGFEEKALKGAKNTIRKFRPQIIIENFSGQEWIEENILKDGYVYYMDIHQNSVFKPG